MPTLPLLHGWLAGPLDDLLEVARVLRAEVVEAALRAAGAAQVHHHDGVAARREVAGQPERLAVGAPCGPGRMRVPSRSASVPWYGLASRMTGKRPRRWAARPRGTAARRRRPGGARRRAASRRRPAPRGPWSSGSRRARRRARRPPGRRRRRARRARRRATDRGRRAFRASKRCPMPCSNAAAARTCGQRLPAPRSSEVVVVDERSRLAAPRARGEDEHRHDERVAARRDAATAGCSRSGSRTIATRPACGSPGA